jgi:uncharacterized RDD family membrane protein YckC
MSIPQPPPPPPGFGSPPPPPPAPGFGAPPPGYQPYQQYGTQRRELAGVGSRIGAYIVDALVQAVFSIPAIVAIFAGPRHTGTCTVNGELRLCRVPNGSTWGIFAVLLLAGVAAFLFFYSKKVSQGGSWGQKATHITIVNRDSYTNISQGKAIGRFFARYISAIPCYLGFLWALWDKDKQTFHDKICGTVVVKS